MSGIVWILAASASEMLGLVAVGEVHEHPVGGGALNGGADR
jgi:hypothetical protein